MFWVSRKWLFACYLCYTQDILCWKLCPVGRSIKQRLFTSVLCLLFHLQLTQPTRLLIYVGAKNSTSRSRFDQKLMKVFLVVSMLADEGEASSALATPPLFPPRTNPRAKKRRNTVFLFSSEAPMCCCVMPLTHNYTLLLKALYQHYYLGPR